MKNHANLFLIMVMLVFWPVQRDKEVECPSSFTISSPRDTYVAYEPMRITFTVANDRDKEIIGYDALGFNVSMVKLFYRREGEEEFRRYESEVTASAKTIEIYLT